MTEPLIVKFYFDIVSPFSYFAFERLCRYEQSWNLSLELIPVHLGTILKSSGNYPPYKGTAKIKYLGMDIRRNIQELQLNWNLDMSKPPVSSLDNMSALNALKTLVSPELFKLVTKRLFAEQVADLSPPSDLFACLVPSHISQDTMDQAKILAQTQEMTAAFEQEQQTLIKEHGAFGLPWTLFQRQGEDHIESFWGSDRMASIACWLGPNYIYAGTSPITSM